MIIFEKSGINYSFPSATFPSLELNGYITHSFPRAMNRNDLFTSRLRQLEPIFPLHPLLALCSDLRGYIQHSDKMAWPPLALVSEKPCAAESSAHQPAASNE